MLVYDQNIIDTSSDINMLDSMYPSFCTMVSNQSKTIEHKYCTIYGYSYGEGRVVVDGKLYYLNAGDFFSFPIRENYPVFNTDDNIFVVVRLGFLGQHVFGKVEKKGRLSYIDGCSDSMLVYPPRFGDPSLNFLHFPSNINQTFHTHPSIRMGCVIGGRGVSTLADKEVQLTEGMMFCLEEQEYHRFRTENSHMDIIAFHPDGDWGPTDENHTMLNRTYLEGK